MGKYSEKIVELRKSGKTYKEIKAELNCASSTVSYHCKLNKIAGYCDRLTDKDKINLQKLYDELGSVKKVAKVTGNAVQTVLKYVVTKRKTNLQTGSESVILWRKRTKQKLVDYKGGKCEICGYSKCIESLHFHHTNPEEKDFSISGKSLSFDRLKQEVDKCILVCSNCHTEIHSGLVKI